MSQDYTGRMRALADDLHHELGRIERMGRALTDAERRRVEALRRAGSLLDQAWQALASAPPAQEGQGRQGGHGRQEGGVMRSDPDELDSDQPRVDRDRGGPIDHVSLGGDDDTPGYPRGEWDSRGGR